MAYLTRVKLYQTAIDPARNLRIEDIEGYLASEEVYEAGSYDDFKRTYPAEELTLRLSRSDVEEEVSQESGLCPNYAKLTYTDGDSDFRWYYFIDSLTYIADATAEVHLVLDSLNSFPWTGWLSDRTLIRRQLIRRWDSNGIQIADPVGEDTSGEIVKIAEGVFAPSPAYLIYRNDEKGGPALYATSVAGLPATGKVTLPKETLNAKLFKGGSVALDGYGLIYRTAADDFIAVSADVAGTAYSYVASGHAAIQVAVEIDSDSVTSLSYARAVVRGDGAVLSQSPKVSLGPTPSDCEISFSAQSQAGVAPGYGSLNASFVLANPTSAKTVPMAEVDRTKSDLARIVEMPYTPDLSAQGFEIRTDGVYLRFSDLEASGLKKTLELDVSRLKATRPTASTSKTEAMANDPKIRSSQFSYCKLVYDSYSTAFGAENLYSGVYKIKIDFVPSSSISSSLIFKASPSISVWRNVKEDYPFMIASDRNNEIPLYSSEWFNYLRNGYNYDKKKLAVDNATAIASGVASAVTSALTIMGGAGLIASGSGAVAGVGMVAGGVTGLASSVAGAGTSVWSRGVSQEQKENALRLQASSVQSINDLSLFKAYGEGALKWEYWGPRDDYRTQLENLFFYKGYARNVFGVPDLHIRTSFDYLECSPSWTGEALSNAQGRFLALLRQRLGEGVTIIHHFEDAWDIAQAKNNREVTE